MFVRLYRHMNEQNVLNAVNTEKDVDAFLPLNIGRLAMQGRDPLFVPCTPKGCVEFLHRYGVEIEGRESIYDWSEKYCWDASCFVASGNSFSQQGLL